MTSTNSVPSAKFEVAIIGGGPAGLAAAIELGKLDFIDWRLYEKKPAISEIGNGITLQRNTWRMLEFMGAAQHISSDDYFKQNDVARYYPQHRNGRTGELINERRPRSDTPLNRHSCRTHRAKLQQALLKEVDQSRIRVGIKLTEISRFGSGDRLRLHFDGGFTDEVDMLVGADGIRSTVRQVVFPEHRMSFTGFTFYRTVVRIEDVRNKSEIPLAGQFWHGTDAKWIYTTPLDENDLEITARIKDPTGDDERASWGRNTSVEAFTQLYADFKPPLQQLLKLVTYAQKFDVFAGSRLETAIDASKSIALVGDASHPLSGAFGAGAGFALEDAYVLAGGLRWAHAEGRPLADGLELFDRVRSPHYKALYATVDDNAHVEEELKTLGLQGDDEIRHRVKNVWNVEKTWMFYHEADNAMRDAIEELRGK